MKFFKFEVHICDSKKSKCFFETHYLNIENIKDIVISSEIGYDCFNIVTDGCVFTIEDKFLDSLLKLVYFDEKEAKK